MRGKDMDTLQTVHDARITPAYAGKRTISEFEHIRIKDHPRVCGEKRFWRRFGEAGMGSPPRMRGKD